MFSKYISRPIRVNCLTERGSALNEYMILMSLVCLIALPGVKVIGENASNNLYGVADAIGGGSASTSGPEDILENPGVPGARGPGNDDPDDNDGMFSGGAVKP